jgi:hypothetical protein
MASQNVLRRVASIPWQNNTLLPAIDMSRLLDLKAIIIRVEGTIDTTVIATSARTLQTEILKRIQLVSGGLISFIDIAFSDLVYGNYARKFQTNSTRTVNLAVANNKAFSFTGVIDMQNYDGVRPTDSNLHTQKLSLLQLLLTTGSATDIFVGGTSAINAATTTITVSVLESMEDMAGYDEPRWIRKTSQQKITVNAANTAMKIPVGNLLRAVRVRAMTGTSTLDEEPTEAMIRNITFSSGTDVRFNLPWTDVKRLNSQDYESDMAAQVGIAIMDLADDNPSIMSRLFNLGAVNQAEIYLDTLAPGAFNEVVLTIDEFIAPPTPAKAA